MLRKGFAVLLSLILLVFAAPVQIVKAVDPLAGTAYAVLESDGDLIFFRSTKKYVHTDNAQSVQDITGKTFKGIIFTGQGSLEAGNNVTGTEAVSPFAGYEEQIRTVSVAANQMIQPVVCDSWFSNHSRLSKFSAAGFDTQNMVSAQSMFANCTSLTSIDLTLLNTGKLKNASYMFTGCSALKTANLSGWNTENLQDMQRLFRDCTALTSVNLNGWDTSHVYFMLGAFYNCYSLKTLDLRSFSTSSFTNTADLFFNCASLVSLNISGMSTLGSPAASNQWHMFDACSKLSVVILGDKMSFWRKESSLPTGFWCHENLSLSESELCEYYPSYASEWKGVWVKANIKPIYDFVKRLYLLCFERTPDDGGISGWITSLAAKEKTAAQVVQGFFNSKEMQNLKLTNEEFIERCYKVMMNRASDAGGKKNWLDKLNSGVSNNYILKGFVASNEFAKICMDYGIVQGTINLTEPRDLNLGITQFVSRCYSEVLGRKADVGGLNNWCKKILDASNKKQAAINTASNGFFHSAEYINKNTTNDQYVKTLYRTFLGREADTGGYNNWMKALNSGQSRDSVMNGFAYSTEFANIMAKYGIR